MGDGMVNPGITPAYICGLVLAAALALVSLGVMVWALLA